MITIDFTILTAAASFWLVVAAVVKLKSKSK